MDFVINSLPYGHAGVIFPIGKKAPKKDVPAESKSQHQVKKVTPPANAKLNSSKAV